MKKLLLAVLLVTGCAGYLPAVKLERSQTSIRSAEELGAARVPNAAVFLQRAKDEQETARHLANLGDPRAETVLACSEADAELAVALAREAAARREHARVAVEV